MRVADKPHNTSACDVSSALYKTLTRLGQLRLSWKNFEVSYIQKTEVATQPLAVDTCRQKLSVTIKLVNNDDVRYFNEISDSPVVCAVSYHRLISA